MRRQFYCNKKFSDINTTRLFSKFKIIATCDTEISNVMAKRPKINCHGKVPSAIEKRGSNRQSTIKYLSHGETLMKIGSVDPEYYLLKCLFFKEKRN